MTLLNAPEFNASRETRNRNLLIGSGVLVLVLALVTVGGYLLGHGWFFNNLLEEHTVSRFLSDVEAKDYVKAYGIWMNDAQWQQHPQKYDYTLQRFTEDWTTASDWGPIRTHHVDISKRSGTGTIVAVTVNGSPKKMFMWYERSNGTLTYPAPYQLQY